MINRLRSLLLKKPRLLVVETDLFNLRAAILRVDPDRLVVERMAISRSIDLLGAFAEAFTQLQPVDMPRRAVLITPEVIPAVLELPVDPASPRSGSEMLEVVRWEMESYLAQYAAARQIGDILIGRGYLSPDQVREILQESEKRKRESLIRPAGERRTVARFGDTAVELGFIERAQLEECLNLQEKLQAGDEDYCYSYAPCGTTSSDGRFNWKVCCVHRSVRDRWEQAFASRKIALDGIYPLVGTSPAALPEEQAQAGPSSVVELQQGLIAATRLQDGNIVGMQIQYTAGKNPTPNMYVDLLGVDARGPIWVSGRHQLLRNLPRELTEVFKREADFIPVPLESTAPEAQAAQAAMIGAFQSATKRAGGKRALAVPPRDPAPPLWHRPQMHIAAAVGIVLLAIGMIEMSLARWKKRVARDEPVLGQLAARKQQAAQAKARELRAKDLQKKLEKGKQELDKAKGAADAFEDALHRKVFKDWRAANLRRICLEDELPRRARYVPALLEAMGESASADVAVERVQEADVDRVEITAWSLSETAAQRFAQALGRSLERWQMRVASVRLKNGKGRLDLEGFEFVITLRRVLPGSAADRLVERPEPPVEVAKEESKPEPILEPPPRSDVDPATAERLQASERIEQALIGKAQKGDGLDRGLGLSFMPGSTLEEQLRNTMARIEDLRRESRQHFEAGEMAQARRALEEVHKLVNGLYDSRAAFRSEARKLGVAFARPLEGSTLGRSVYQERIDLEKAYRAKLEQQ